MSRRRPAIAALALAAACDHSATTAPSPASAPAIPRPELGSVADAPLTQAVVAAQARIEKSPDDLAAWEAYGALLATHDWRREAAAAFAAAEALEPKNFRWPYLQGLQLAPCDVAAALAAYERALGIDPDYAPGHVNCGRLLLELARHGEAIGRFEQAIRLDEKSVDGWLGLGQARLLMHEPAAAEQALRRAFALEPDHPEVRSALSSACFALGRKEEAKEHARVTQAKARSVHVADPRAKIPFVPVTAGDHVNAALQRMDEKKFAEAERYLRQALQIQPESIAAWTNLATVLLERDDLVGAETALRESIRITPSADAEFRLAGVLYRSGRKSEAADARAAAARLAPADVVTQEKAGMILLEVGRFADAAERFAAVAAARPGDEPARLRLATTLRSLAVDQLHHKLVAEGIATMRRALAAKPDHFPIERDLAFLLATLPSDEQRNGVEAVKLAEHARLGREESAVILDALAAAYAEVGRFDDAVAAVERALEAARKGGRAAEGRSFEARLKLYRARKPLRIPPEAVR